MLRPLHSSRGRPACASPNRKILCSGNSSMLPALFSRPSSLRRPATSRSPIGAHFAPYHVIGPAGGWPVCEGARPQEFCWHECRSIARKDDRTITLRRGKAQIGVRMGNTWIVDLTHFLTASGVLSHLAALDAEDDHLNVLTNQQLFIQPPG